MYQALGTPHGTRKKDLFLSLLGLHAGYQETKVKHKEAQICRRVPHVVMTIKQGADSTEHMTAGGSHLASQRFGANAFPEHSNSYLLICCLTAFAQQRRS